MSDESEKKVSLKFKIKTELLAEYLTLLKPIVPAKPTRDSLKCVKIKASFGESDGNGSLPPSILTLYVSDQETYAQFQIEDDTNLVVEIPGEILVSAQPFLDYIKVCSGSSITIQSNGDTTLIKDTETLFKLACQEVGDFPKFPTIPEVSDLVEVAMEDPEEEVPETTQAEAGAEESEEPEQVEDYQDQDQDQDQEDYAANESLEVGEIDD